MYKPHNLTFLQYRDQQDPCQCLMGLIWHQAMCKLVSVRPNNVKAGTRGVAEGATIPKPAKFDELFRAISVAYEARLQDHCSRLQADQTHQNLCALPYLAAHCLNMMSLSKQGHASGRNWLGEHASLSICCHFFAHSGTVSVVHSLHNHANYR